MGFWQLQRLPAKTLLSIIMTVTSLYLCSGKTCDSSDENDELERGDTDTEETARRKRRWHQEELGMSGGVTRSCSMKECELFTDFSQTSTKSPSAMGTKRLTGYVRGSVNLSHQR